MVNLLTPNTRVIAARNLEFNWQGYPMTIPKGSKGLIVDPTSQTVKEHEILVSWNKFPYQIPLGRLDVRAIA